MLLNFIFVVYTIRNFNRLKELKDLSLISVQNFETMNEFFLAQASVCISLMKCSIPTYRISRTAFANLTQAAQCPQVRCCSALLLGPPLPAGATALLRSIKAVKPAWLQYPTSTSPPPSLSVAHPLIIFMHLAFLHLLPLCLAPPAASQWFFNAPLRLEFPANSPVLCDGIPFPPPTTRSLPALLPLAVSLVGLVDTPTPCSTPNTPACPDLQWATHNMHFISNAVSFAQRQPVSCLQVTKAPNPSPFEHFLPAPAVWQSLLEPRLAVESDSETFNSADWLQSTIVCSLYSIYLQLDG